MFSTIRKRFTYANVAMTLALVFAMSGGAYAAKQYLITSTKQISPKVLKSLKGSNGKNGAAGPAGPAGAAGVGTAGPAGPQGPAGPGGAAGTAGTNGTNGKEGKPGTTGFTETLPSGKTETGVWAVRGLPAKGVEVVANGALSFPIPLAAAPTSSAAQRYIGVEEGEGELKQSQFIPEICKGTVENPGAAPGNLCVFAAEAEDFTGMRMSNTGVKGNPAIGVGKNGAIYQAFAAGEGTVNASGTWAVTAE